MLSRTHTPSLFRPRNRTELNALKEPSQSATWSADPRRVDAVNRLRCERRTFRAEWAARGLVVERHGAGGDIPARSSRPDLQSVSGGQAAAFQRLLSHRGR